MPIREAAGLDVLFIFGLIWFFLSFVQKAQKAAQKQAQGAARPEPEPGAGRAGEQQTSLEAVLREIEKVKAQHRMDPPAQGRMAAAAAAPRRLEPAPGKFPARRHVPPPRKAVVQDERGPLGRMSQVRLSGVTSSEGGIPRVEDQDDSAEAIVQARIDAAEARNRAFSEEDHESFHERFMQGDAPAGAPVRHTNQRLREALIWREILGPPKAFE